MLRRFSGLLALALFFPGVTLAQAPAKTNTGPTVQELQQQVIELQSKLMECQNTARAATPSPMRDALEAFQTFNSTLSVGFNYPGYKEALIPLKVRVDRLPDKPETAELRKNLQRFMDAESLWSATFNVSYLEAGFLQPYTVTYEKEWAKTEEGWKRDGGKPCLKAMGHNLRACMLRFSEALIKQGQENIKGFPKP